MKPICIDKEIMGGTPVFEGSRVPIKNLFDYLEEGHSIDTFLDEFPSVNRQQVLQVMKFYKQKKEKVSKL